jgi:hypothetical protein
LPEAPKPDGGEPETVPKALKPPSAAVPLIRKAIGQLANDDGWVGLGPVGSHLSKLASDFDPRTYGHAKLSDLVNKTGAFELKRPEIGGIYIRVKPTKSATAKT